MTDLKPCPFCGGDAVYCFNTAKPEMPMHWYLCRSCHASPGDRATETDAITAWNTRADGGQQSMQAEIERLREALKRQSAAVRSLHHNEETEINRLRAERTQWYYAISTLESERKANAILTSEIERLRLALEAKDALHVSAYQAGLKAGWNFCINDDGVGFAKATSGTDHIAELRRINEARTALGDTK